MLRALIITGYTRSDPTIAGLQAGDFLCRAGYSVEVFPVGEMSKVSDRWDKISARHAGKSLINVLKPGFDLILWTSIPDENSLMRCRKFTSKNYLLAAWDQIPLSLRDDCQEFDALICPSWAAYQHFKRTWNIEKLFYVPWEMSVSCPVLDERARKIRQECVRLFWPLYGWQAYRHDAGVYTGIDKFLRENHNAVITVGTSINKKISRRSAMYALSNRYPSRFQVFQHYDREAHAVEMARHDICLWPVLFEAFGIEALTALCLGLPVAAFDCAPWTEFLRDRHNAMLVKASADKLHNGVPCVRPDYDRFFSQLSSLLSKPKEIAALRSCSHVDLEKRSALNFAGWERALK